MPQVCTICSHSERLKIEAAIIAGLALRRVASQFSTSDATLRRHKQNCMKIALQAVQVEQKEQSARQEEQSAWNAISEMEWMHEQVRLIYTESREGDAKDNRIALQALAESRKQTELFSELLGNTEQSNQEQLEQEWITLREAIFGALEPFPDARLAVGRALLALKRSHDVYTA